MTRPEQKVNGCYQLVVAVVTVIVVCTCLYGSYVK